MDQITALNNAANEIGNQLEGARRFFAGLPKLFNTFFGSWLDNGKMPGISFNGNIDPDQGSSGDAVIYTKPKK